MKSTVFLLLLGVLVTVSSIPVAEHAPEQQNAIVPKPKPLILPKLIEEPREDSVKADGKDELEGAESAYIAYPYFHPYVYKYPVIVYGK